MLFRLRLRVQKFLKLSREYNQSAHKLVYNMNIAYFRHTESDNQFHITFRYVNEAFAIDRTFNFSRYITENISTCMDRIRTNVEKEFQKKTKKKKNKKELDHLIPTRPVPNVVIELWKNNNHQIIDGTFKDVLPPKEEMFLKIIDRNFKVVFNSPWVSQITLPTSILAGFLVYPSKLELQFAEKADCTFKWYCGQPTKSKQDDDIEWKEIDEGFIHRTKNNEINNKVKVVCTPYNGSVIGPSGEFISKNTVQAGPGQCPFEERQQFTENFLSGKKFRVMSYNILADLYADSDFARKNLFGYCAQYALDLDYRKQLFIKEITGYKADLICLQEVDSKVFDLDLKILLETIDIKGVYQKKGTTAEGLATFYNQRRFE